MADGGCERHGERPEPRADLDDVVGRADELSDRSPQIRIDQEILAQRPGRPDAVSPRERSDRGGAETVGGAARATS
jgi:hypothetical protein